MQLKKRPEKENNMNDKRRIATKQKIKNHKINDEKKTKCKIKSHKINGKKIINI